MNILDCNGMSADRKFRQLESISLERYSIAPRPSLLRRIIAQILQLCKVPSFRLHQGIRAYKYKTGGRVLPLEVDDVDLQENEGVVSLAKEADEEARRLL